MYIILKKKRKNFFFHELSSFHLCSFEVWIHFEFKVIQYFVHCYCKQLLIVLLTSRFELGTFGLTVGWTFDENRASILPLHQGARSF